jgi:hypothetical protein
MRVTWSILCFWNSKKPIFPIRSGYQCAWSLPIDPMALGRRPVDLSQRAKLPSSSCSKFYGI